MSREAHVRIRGSRRVRFPPATRLHLRLGDTVQQSEQEVKGMPRAADLDIGDIDASRGKQAEMLTPAGKGSRDLERAGLRDLDQRTENLPGLTRQKKDLNRRCPGTEPVLRCVPPTATGFAAWTARATAADRRAEDGPGR